MDTPKPAPSGHPAATFDFRVAAWLELRHEMQELHARLQYIKLMLKLGVRVSEKR